MRYLIWMIPLCAVACAAPGWPTTKMEPVADYGSGHVTVSAVPARTAGPSYVTTTSPDGATRFVCTDGSTRPGNRVPPHQEPAC